MAELYGVDAIKRGGTNGVAEVAGLYSSADVAPELFEVVVTIDGLDVPCCRRSRSGLV